VGGSDTAESMLPVGARGCRDCVRGSAIVSSGSKLGLNRMVFLRGQASLTRECESIELHVIEFDERLDRSHTVIGKSSVSCVGEP
jgi:hypothetical protein